MLLKETNLIGQEDLLKARNIVLSYSSVSLFLECPRCFWFEKVQGIKRPDTVMPSLPRGMDKVIKEYFDRFRAKGELPPELTGRVIGKLMPDQELLERWRDWRAGLRWRDPESGAEWMGALDDCLVHEQNYIPLDYKTRGFPLKEDSASFYQNQLDTYTFLLRENGYAHCSLGYLVFYHPVEHDLHGMIRFEISPHQVRTDPDRAQQIFFDAVRTLRDLEPPRPNERCGFCYWLEAIREPSTR